MGQAPIPVGCRASMQPQPPTQLDAIFARGLEVWRAHPELVARFGDPGSLGYWSWLMASQWPEDEDLQRLLPTPPHEFISRVSGAHSTAVRFHESGLSDAQTFHELFAAAGFDFTRKSALLDYGCGFGRVLRCLSRVADTTELHGADVDADAVAWCRAHLTFGAFATIPVRPPTPYPDGFFAGAYGFSVFTHLPEDLHLQWLDELARILAPGGILILTTHGQRCVDDFAAGKVPHFEFPSPAQMRKDLPELSRRGFGYYPYPASFNVSLPEGDRDAGLHGMTYILPHYVRSHWLRQFDLVRHAEAPKDWQDFVVLRRKPGA